jgi:hypothetical protein
VSGSGHTSNSRGNRGAELEKTAAQLFGSVLSWGAVSKSPCY